jgi:hypothetical protein
MGFVPIPLDQYVKLHLRRNRGGDAKEVAARLRNALAAHRAGIRCRCGQAIWVIGSAEVGASCFTCITGEAEPSGDYEIDEACAKSDA